MFLEKPNPSTNPKVLSSQTVPGNSKTVSLDNLSPNTTYFIKLVVTNPNIVGFNVKDDMAYTGDVPKENFVISELHTSGAIETVGPPDTNNNLEIIYNTKPNKNNLADQWEYDTAKFTITQKGVGKFSGIDFALYNNKGVLTSKDIKILEQEDSELTNARWIYSGLENNRWCLISNPNLCMNLTTPTSGIDKISIIRDTKSQWKNLRVASPMSL